MWYISESFIKKEVTLEELLNVKFTPEIQSYYKKWKKAPEEKVEMPDGIMDFHDIVDENYTRC